MTCSNCGMEMPLKGRLCPYCRADMSQIKRVHLNYLTADKSQDTKADFKGQQMAYVVTYVLALIGGVLGFLIGNAFLGWVGVIVFILIGIFVGGVIGVNSARKGSGQGKQAAYSGTPVAVPVPQPTNQPGPLTPDQERNMLASGQYKKCAHCAEVIRSDAKLCRFCGYDVAASVVQGR